MLDLDHSDPAILALSATPRELHATLRKLDDWNETRLRCADLLLLNWTTRACARNDDRQEISEMLRTLLQALGDTPAAASLPADYHQRGSAYRDVLEARRLELSLRNPEAQLKRRHVPEILKHIRNKADAVRQGELIEALHLDITPGRLSQLLGALEYNGLITRQRQGRDNLLKLTAAGEQALPARQAESVRHPFRSLLSPTMQQKEAA